MYKPTAPISVLPPSFNAENGFTFDVESRSLKLSSTNSDMVLAIVKDGNDNVFDQIWNMDDVLAFLKSESKAFDAYWTRAQRNLEWELGSASYYLVDHIHKSVEKIEDYLRRNPIHPRDRYKETISYPQLHGIGSVRISARDVLALQKSQDDQIVHDQCTDKVLLIRDEEKQDFSNIGLGLDLKDPEQSLLVMIVRAKWESEPGSYDRSKHLQELNLSGNAIVIAVKQAAVMKMLIEFFKQCKFSCKRDLLEQIKVERNDLIAILRIDEKSKNKALRAFNDVLYVIELRLEKKLIPKLVGQIEKKDLIAVLSSFAILSPDEKALRNLYTQFYRTDNPQLSQKGKSPVVERVNRDALSMIRGLSPQTKRNLGISYRLEY